MRDRIVVIGRTETLDADVQRLRVRAGLDARAVLPTDAVAAHRSPPDAPRALSPAAYGAFRALCRDDEPIVAWCRARRRELLGEDESDDPPRALQAG